MKLTHTLWTWSATVREGAPPRRGCSSSSVMVPNTKGISAARAPPPPRRGFSSRGRGGGGRLAGAVDGEAVLRQAVRARDSTESRVVDQVDAGRRDQEQPGLVVVRSDQQRDAAALARGA